MSKLIIQTGKLKGKVLPIPPTATEIFIGRDEDCFIRMGSPEVSRRHCSIKRTDEGLVVSDLESSNGTYLNGFPISVPMLLQQGDVIRIGPAEFQLDGPKPESHVIDDEIADWLSDGDSRVGKFGSGDTTIMKSSSTEKEIPAPLPGASNPIPASLPHPSGFIPKKKIFATLHDEALDIIRRHQESLDN